MSLEAQESRIRTWAEATGAEVGETARDEGVSGTKLVAERPAGQRIAKLIDAGGRRYHVSRGNRQSRANNP